MPKPVKLASLAPSFEHLSFMEVLKREKGLTDGFFDLISILSLEELIFIKLEQASSAFNHKFFGLKLWNNLIYIVKEAVFNFVVSCTVSDKQGAMVLNMEQDRFIQIKNSLESWKKTNAFREIVSSFGIRNYGKDIPSQV